MGFNLQDKIEISLFFSGDEFQLNAYNTLSFLQIDISERQILPQVSLSITDASMTLASGGYLQDAAPFSVVLKPVGAVESQTFNFRIFKFREVKTVSGTRYQIDGFWDSIPYWFTTSSAGYRGTSDSLLNQIATVSGMKYSGVATSDSQLWMPQNMTYGMWAKDATLHGYVSDKSLMVLGVDVINSEATMVYRDFNAIQTTPLVVAVGQVNPGEISCVDFRVHANGGPANKNSGYYQTRYAQSATGPDQTAHQNMTVTPNSRSPLFSLEARQVAKRGTNLYSGISFGNINTDAYEKARYQNARGAGLMSARIDAMTISVSGARLFDRINVVARNESGDGEVDNTWSGIYTVTSISYRIDTTNYCEVLEGYRDGTNQVE